MEDWMIIGGLDTPLARGQANLGDGAEYVIQDEDHEEYVRI